MADLHRICAIFRKTSFMVVLVLVSQPLADRFVRSRSRCPSLYLPLFAWAMLAGVVIATVVERPFP